MWVHLAWVWMYREAVISLISRRCGGTLDSMQGTCLLCPQAFGQKSRDSVMVEVYVGIYGIGEGSHER